MSTALNKTQISPWLLYNWVSRTDLFLQKWQQIQKKENESLKISIESNIWPGILEAFSITRNSTNLILMRNFWQILQCNKYNFGTHVAHAEPTQSTLKNLWKFHSNHQNDKTDKIAKLFFFFFLYQNPKYIEFECGRHYFSHRKWRLMAHAAIKYKSAHGKCYA